MVCVGRSALVLLLLSAPLLADGVAFKGVDLSALHPAEENEQVAVIAHRDGRQRMCILCRFDAEEAEKALWIFPVLGAPSSVTVDMCDELPAPSYGSDPVAQARSQLGDWMMLAATTQVWPFPVLGCLMPTLSRSRSAGVDVYAQAERWGIRVEVVQADSVEALQAHLADGGATAPRGALDAFAPYVGASHALVVAWVASAAEAKAHFAANSSGYFAGRRSPCVYVEFPTQRPFYPMRPTASYGDIVVPLRLYLVGWYEPSCSAPMRRRIQVRQYVEGSLLRHDYPDEAALARHTQIAARIAGESDSGIRYTIVSCEARASAYSEDLWFDETQGTAQVRYALATMEMLGSERVGVPLFFGVVGVLSYISAGISGLLLCGRWRGIAIVGLWNVLTIIGLGIAIHRLRGEKGDRLRETTQANGRGFTKFLWVFSFVFLGLCLGVYGLLLLPLL